MKQPAPNLWRPRRQPKLSPAQQQRRTAYLADITTNARPGNSHFLILPTPTKSNPNPTHAAVPIASPLESLRKPISAC